MYSSTEKNKGRLEISNAIIRCCPLNKVSFIPNTLSNNIQYRTYLLGSIETKHPV